MKWKNEAKPLFLITGVFLILYYLPVGFVRLENALIEAVYLARWYAREHVITCLVPAFFIAGAISVFISQACCNKISGAEKLKGLPHTASQLFQDLFLQSVHAQSFLFFPGSTKWARPWTGHSLSLCRPCSKCSGNHTYCKGSGT